MAGDTSAVCVLDGGEVRVVVARDDVAGRDTTGGAPSAARVFPPLPPPHGEEREWYRQRRAIRFEGREFFWNGPPLAALPEEIRRIGTVDGIALYASRDDPPGDSPIVFVPARPGCQLQPYYYLDETVSTTAGVRRPS